MSPARQKSPARHESPARHDSPAQNRVGPLGDVVAAPGRGAWMGNRGVLHEGRGSRTVVRASRGRAWLICALSFKDRTLPQWEPGRNTQLFFLDEAVALAAGHRPCAECRRAAYNTYRSAWAGPDNPRPGAKDVDLQLASERGRPGERRPQPLDWAGLPDGVFVLTGQGPAVVVGDHLTLWRADNSYGRQLERPRQGQVPVITPRSSVRALGRGYPVQLDAATGPAATGPAATGPAATGPAATGPAWSGCR